MFYDLSVKTTGFNDFLVFQSLVIVRYTRRRSYTTRAEVTKKAREPLSDPRAFARCCEVTHSCGDGT
jgi:hypothetical protein